ncbi:MAG: wax ester/triacylglycerol synthase family O-acyltransferase [Acidobacteriia bacterium]|nr:wax ester/triacylglycerol synthase family O-acyltransferase [Terriglobia bacterium]
MARVYPGDRLASEDAVFLYLERKEMPLHIGSVSVFDGPIPFEACREFIESRLPLIPRYRQRIVAPPLNVGHPTWEPDPDFDISNHVHHAQLKRGTDAELRNFAGRLFTQMMDRSRPLWDMTIVDGLSGGRSVLISRVHHCLVDGVSGVGLLNVLLDPTLQPQSGHKNRYHAPPLPGPSASLVDALATSYSEMVERMLSAQAATLNIVQSLMSDQALRGLDQLLRLVPELLAPVERLPFNQACLGPRKVAWSEFSIPEVKKVREACGGTLNDVVLTVVTSAVRRYAELHGAPVKNRLLRLMVPVNLRREGEPNGLGNRVSMLPVSVPLDLRDPVKLLDAIRQRTEALKTARVADLIHLLATWVGATPAPLQALLDPLTSLLPVPPFNLVCTNVPGPQAPLYVLGREMLTYYPYVPIGNEMGLGCAIQSYNHKLYFGLTGDAAVVPDIDRLKRFLDQALQELRQAAGVGVAKAHRRPRPARAVRPAAVQEAPAMAEQAGARIEQPSVEHAQASVETEQPFVGIEQPVLGIELEAPALNGAGPEVVHEPAIPVSAAPGAN